MKIIRFQIDTLPGSWVPVPAELSLKLSSLSRDPLALIKMPDKRALVGLHEPFKHDDDQAIFGPCISVHRS